MFQSSESRIFPTLLLIPLCCALLVIGVDAFAMYNMQQDLWLLGHRLISIIPIRLSTGLGFLLSGLVLILRCIMPVRRGGRIALAVLTSLLALLVLLLGLATLAQYLPGLDVGLDQFFATLAGGAITYTGRMTPLAAFGFVLVGLSLLLIDYRSPRGHYLTEYMAFILTGVMGIPLIGHIYKVISIEELSAAQTMPPYISLLFFALAIGILSARPRHPLMSLWNSTLPGGTLLRRLLPSSLLLLVTLDSVIKWGVQNHLYNADKASPLLILLSCALLLILFSRTAALLNREYEDKQKGEAALARSNALLRAVSDNTPDAIFVKDMNGRMVFANPSKLRLLAKEHDQVIGFYNADLYSDPIDAARINLEDHSVLESGTARVFETTTRFSHGVRTLHSTKAPWLNANGEIVGLVGISTDITERKRMEDALKTHETQLEALVAARTSEVSELIGHLETTREEEKRAIARELHDDLGSALTALNMHLSLVFQQMPPDPKIAERIGKIKTLLGSITNATRRIQIGLRPDKLDVFGIKVAIAEQAAEFEIYSGVKCNASLPDDQLIYAPRVDIALFRMVQEALNNIAKHAQATHVDVILDDADDEIVLTIRDNGVGLPAEQPGAVMTHGLRGMRERAGYLGGSVKISSKAGQGTSIVIVIPKIEANTKVPEGNSDEYALGSP